MPKIHRPGVKAVSWGVQTTWVPIRGQHGDRPINRDPWKAEMTGYNEGSTVRMATQVQSRGIALPEPCAGCKPGRRTRKITNPRKLARKARSRAWRAAVSNALSWEPVAEVKTTVNSHKETQIHESTAVMPTHTPMKITARGPFGRKYAKVQTNVEGLPTTPAGTTRRQVIVHGSRYSQTGNIDNSGLHVPAYAPWATTANVFVTPAYNKGDRAEVKLLGLAAFPAGSTITVRNMRLASEGADGHTASFTASRSGSGAVRIPGFQNDKLQVTVSYPAVDNQAHGSSHSFTVRVPRTSGKPAIKARGIRYMAAQMAD
jgi:hypothetical protein